jgi:hypothetical protein
MRALTGWLAFGALCVVACGDATRSPTTGSAGTTSAAGSAGTTSNAGTTGNAGSGGAAGQSGGSAATIAGNAATGGNTPCAPSGNGMGGADASCPATRPSMGDACTTADQVCAYEDCGGVGRTIARCSSASWSVETAPCGQFAICTGGLACGAGAVCLVIPGYPSIDNGECVPHRCGTGPISCSCLQGCTAGCELSATLKGSTMACTARRCP